MKITTGNLIDSKKAKELIEKFGATVSVEGSLPQLLHPDEIEQKDAFQAVINYGMGVQLHLAGETRVCITLDTLKGQTDGLEWYAIA